jgi:hypothetical protein
VSSTQRKKDLARNGRRKHNNLSALNAQTLLILNLFAAFFLAVILPTIFFQDATSISGLRRVKIKRPEIFHYNTTEKRESKNRNEIFINVAE